MLHTDLKVKHQTYITTRIPLKTRDGRPYETVTGRAHATDYIFFWHILQVVEYILPRMLYILQSTILKFQLMLVKELINLLFIIMACL